MHAFRLITVLALASLAAATSAAARPTSFAGNVCRLLTAKQVAAVQGVAPKCTNAAPMPGPGAKIFSASWPGKTPRSSTLQVTISAYADKGLLARAKQNLDQGLPGPPRKVAGFGGGAYEAFGAGSAAMHFAVGKDVVVVILTSVARSARTTSELQAVAKAVAARV